MTGADERESGWTIGKVLEWSRTYLRKHESASPLLDADLLLLGVLGCERIDLYTRYDQPLQSEELAAFRQRLQRRAAGEPVAYITGRQEFFGHSFGVSPAVLIPRPDTECLVEAVIEAVIEAANGAATVPGPRILDLGCGSGCIIVSLALELKSGFFEGWDNSPGALQQARDNAADLEADVRLLERDMCDEAVWQKGEPFDYIVCNPPYISTAEESDLPVSVRDYEPRQALFAPDRGLAFYEFLGQYAGLRLKSDGRIFFEVGFQQADSVTDILQAGGWRDLSYRHDLGGHRRMVSAMPPVRV